MEELQTFLLIERPWSSSRGSVLKSIIKKSEFFTRLIESIVIF